MSVKTKCIEVKKDRKDSGFSVVLSIPTNKCVCYVVSI